MRFAIFALLVATAASGAQAAERRLSVTDFDRVRVVGAAQVDIQKGRAVSAFADGSPEALDDLVVEVVDRELIVQPRARVASTWSGNGGPPARVRVTVPRLTSVRVSGSANVTVAEMSAASIAMAVTGTGRLNVKSAFADRATLGLTGSGTLVVSGKVKSLLAGTRGSGRVDAAGLTADDLTLTAATSGELALTATRSASVTSTGSGAVTILGEPACTVSNTGSGAVLCGRNAR
jgi:Putative auto-transporter adhesin, head GIN domain